MQPPPPPPPPAGARSVSRPTPPRVRTDELELLAPIALPEDIQPELAIDLGLPTGPYEGVEGGVPDGVPGGVIAGLPPPAAHRGPEPKAVRVGGEVERPVKVKNVVPEYPPLALQARVQGVVILECTISPRGAVSDVEVLRGIPLLNDAAVDAVRQWVYTPTLLNGVPVPVIMTVTVHFQLR
jgi:protein TonB